MKLVIIGNSAASTAAIESFRKNDDKAEILQLSNESHPLYSRCLLPNYLADQLSLENLKYREIDFHRQMKVELKINKQVISVDTNRQQVKCKDNSSFEYDKLLICTGSSAIIPASLEKKIKGVFVLRSVTDAEEIKSRIPATRQAIILGGGLIGMKAAQSLSAKGIKVKVIIGSSHVLSQMIDGQAAEIINRKLKTSKVEVLVKTDIKEIVSQSENLTAVKTDQGQEIDCDLLIIAKGVKPNIKLISETAIKTGVGIKTNSKMQTSLENIYAAGDVAETFDISLDEYTVNSLWTSAVEQGRIAGYNLAGIKKIYDGSLGMNSLNLFNTPLISFGNVNPRADSQYEIIIDNRLAEGKYKKMVIKDDKIKGLILLGDISRAGTLLALLRSRENISKIKNDLLDERFNYGYLMHRGSPKFLGEFSY